MPNSKPCIQVIGVNAEGTALSDRRADISTLRDFESEADVDGSANICRKAVSVSGSVIYSCF